MEALSATQRLVLSQQESTKRLEQNMSKLTKDVIQMQEELKSSTASSTGKGSNTSRLKIPSELSVSNLVKCQ